MDSTTYPYQYSSCRRWPVRHNSGPSIEKVKRPKWWKPHRPKRKKYFCTGISANVWDGLIGWSSTTQHRMVVRKANRRWRHKSKQALRQGDYDALPYTSVAWIW